MEMYREDTQLARSSGRQPRSLFRDIRAAAESGWDFSSRWFAESRKRAALDTTASVPVDLNALMFGLENAIGAACKRRRGRGLRTTNSPGAPPDAAPSHRSISLGWSRRGVLSTFIGRSIASAFDASVRGETLYPLFVGLASRAQAASVAKVSRAGKLLKAGGIVRPRPWSPVSNAGCAQRGGRPCKWIAIDGLRHYDQGSLAETIAVLPLDTEMCRVSYQQSGKLVE